MIQDKDNTRDEARVVKMDLPEAKDIPGQEHIHVPPLGELADTTISSADEEGENVFNDTDETNEIEGTNREGEELENEMDATAEEDSDITEEERDLLEEAATKDPAYQEEWNASRAKIDMTDDDGDLLNEDEELDVPGSEEDDDMEDIGAEDEENNDFSIDKDDAR